MTGGGVPVWCYAGEDIWALTGDAGGSALPTELGPWVLRKMLTITGSDPDEAEALQLIREHGFCCFDPVPTDEEAISQ